MRTEVEADLIARNEVEVPPVPEELSDWAKMHPIFVYNCSPDKFQVQHPMLGIVTIHGCPEGEPYSAPTEIPGLIPYGVRTEMTTAELRHESGRQFAIDLIGLGAFKDQQKSLYMRGVFIAAGNTFNPTKVKSFRIGTPHGKSSSITLPEWVDLKIGKCLEEPTKEEIKAAQGRARDWDRFLLSEGDALSDQNNVKDIQPEHRHAARRLGQNRTWDQPIQSMIDCPGCAQKIPPTTVVHTCGAVLDWEKAIALGMRKSEDRPGSSSSKK
jgi:hypothetical protein